MSIEWEGRRSVKRSRWDGESHDSRNMEWRDTPQLREDAVMLVRRPKPLPTTPTSTQNLELKTAKMIKKLA